ncbi:hypothetical protein BDL97_15G074400 [Sphagnum fallax]|nr:hypothetical protein BDL97_15G074400 [Sphagnum fallax]
MDHVTATAAVEASEDDSGPSSSFSLLEYKKASTQASIAQELQQPQPMAYYQLLLLPRQPDPSPNSHLGYASDLQQPIMPYMIAGYAPSMVHLLPAFAS